MPRFGLFLQPKPLSVTAPAEIRVSETPPKRSSVARIHPRYTSAGQASGRTTRLLRDILSRDYFVEPPLRRTNTSRCIRLDAKDCVERLTAFNRTVRETATLSVRLTKPDVPGRSPHDGSAINVVRF